MSAVRADRTNHPLHFWTSEPAVSAFRLCLLCGYRLGWCSWAGSTAEPALMKTVQMAPHEQRPRHHLTNVPVTSQPVPQPRVLITVKRKAHKCTIANIMVQWSRKNAMSRASGTLSRTSLLRFALGCLCRWFKRLGNHVNCSFERTATNTVKHITASRGLWDGRRGAQRST